VSEGHSGSTSVAIGSDGDVGIDIESLNPTVDFAGIARRWFTPAEKDRLVKCSSAIDERVEFVRIWTAREPATKLTGEGIARTLARHEVLIRPTASSTWGATYRSQYRLWSRTRTSCPLRSPPWLLRQWRVELGLQEPERPDKRHTDSVL
jgi:4'-phosphopantetheinyl transferase